MRINRKKLVDFIVMESDNSLQPVKILADELKNEDSQVRLHAIQRLGTIANALGTERTRTELIPQINGNKRNSI